jgi:hypothetical protein
MKELMMIIIVNCVVVKIIDVFFLSVHLSLFCLPNKAVAQSV